MAFFTDKEIRVLSALGPDEGSISLDDVARLASIYGGTNVQRHLEIGRHRGFSTLSFATMFARIFGHGTVSVTSLSPRFDLGKETSMQPLFEGVSELGLRGSVDVLYGWSHVEGPREVSRLGVLDSAFIDGAHEADIAWWDLCLVNTHMRLGGIVVLDDVIPTNGTTQREWEFTLRNLRGKFKTGPEAVASLAVRSKAFEIVEAGISRFAVLRKVSDLKMPSPLTLWNAMHGGKDPDSALRKSNGEPLYPWREDPVSFEIFWEKFA